MAAALIAGAFGTAGTAQAAIQQDDFVSGSPQHANTAVIAGGVEIAPAFIDTFDQLPASSLKPWPAASADVSRVEAGDMLLNEALFNSGASAGVGTSVKFRGILGAQDNQHVGYASGFENGRWAIFSRKEGSNVLSARMQNGGADQLLELPTVNPNIAHDFRIDRTAQGFKFYVDGNQVAEHTDPFADPLFAQASDLSPGVPLSLESMSVHDKTGGTFTSKVFDAGTAAVTGINFSSTTASGLSYATSTSNDGSNWTSFSTGAIQPARYFRYQATFSATNPGASPRLSTAVVDFAIANPPAGGGNNTPPPSGDTKKPKLSIPRDADVNRRGKVKILLTCPDDELFCRAALALKSGRKTIASKSGKIAGGDSRYVTLKLSKAAKKQLAKARKMKVKAVLTVVDAAGNKRTSSKKIWLYRL